MTMTETLTVNKAGDKLVARRGRRIKRVALTPRTAGLLADSLRRRDGRVTGLHWDGNRLTWKGDTATAEVDGLAVSLGAEEAGKLAERLDPPPANPDEPFIRFRESNNWEMERWSFYIALRGNEEAIRILAEAAARLEPREGCFAGGYIPYDVRMVPIPEHWVDRICRRSRGGYLMAHNKIDGRLDLRKIKAAARRMGEEGDPLYKGGLESMSRPWGRRPAKPDWPTARHRAALGRLAVRELHRRTAGRMLKGNGRGFAGGFRLGRPRMSYQNKCYEAVLRLEAAGLTTAGKVARLTRGQLLKVPGIGRETANMARWMLYDIGLAD